MKPKDLPLFRDTAAKKVLAEECRKNGITPALVQRLLEIQRNYSGKAVAIGISADFDSAIADFLEAEAEATSPPRAARVS